MLIGKSFLEKNDGSRLSQYVTCACVSIVLFTSGMHTGWSAPSLRKILSSEYPFSVTESEASYITIVGSVGHVLGGFLASTLADVLGRKRTILGIAFPQALAFILIYFSYYEKLLLYCARVIGGMGEGATLALAQTYIAEISESDIRGILGTFNTIAYVSGALFINVVGSYFTIHDAAAIGLFFPVLLWLTFTSMPESPYYLLMKGDVDGATRSLRILRRKTNVDKEVMSLTADVARQMSESGTYKDLFTIKSNRKALMYVTAARIFQQYTGYSAFSAYYQILIEQSTNLSPVMGSSLLLLTQIIVTCFVFFFIDTYGRKSIFVFSSATSFLVLASLGTFFAIRDYSSIDVSNLHWLPLLMMVVFVVTFSSGVGTALNIFASEMYAASIKAKAMSVGSIVIASTMMSSTKFYQYTADNFGLIVPFYSFAAITLLGTLFFRYMLPETKGKTLETIQQELKGNFKDNLRLKA